MKKRKLKNLLSFGVIETTLNRLMSNQNRVLHVKSARFKNLKKFVFHNFIIKENKETLLKTDMPASLEQLRQKCRACRSAKETLVPIFSDLKVYDRVLRLQEMLAVYGVLELDPNDGFPQQICYGCVLEIAAVEIFREKCQKSDHIFRRLAKTETNLSPTNVDDNFEVTIKEEVIQENIDEVLCSEEHGIQENDVETNLVSKEQTETVQKKGKSKSKIKQRIDFMCELCGKKLKNKAGLTQHMCCNKTKVDDLKCTICNKRQVDKSTLRRHMDVHNIEAIYNCELCDQKFRRAEAKRKHIILEHGDSGLLETKRRVFQCPYCPKKFFKHLYEEHLRSHTGERPIQCYFCSSRFVSNKKVHEHQRYICQATMKAYTSHIDDIQAEDEDECNEPFEETKQEDGLIVVRIRRSEWTRCDQFRCNICPRRFPSDMQLRRHKQQHDPNAPPKKSRQKKPSMFFFVFGLFTKFL